MAGVRKEDLKVEVEDNVLQIRGEKTAESEDVNDKWHRAERRRGTFVRRFRLKEDANLDEVKCGLERGVLTITIPKKETDKAPANVRYIDLA